MCDKGVVREQNGVVGHHWIAGGQDASRHMAHAVQYAVIHQEVVHQQLFAHAETQIAAGGPNVAQQSLPTAYRRQTCLPQTLLPPSVGSWSSSTV